MTFEELKSKMGDWLGKDTDSLPDAVRGDIVNMAIREYLRTLDLRFGELTTAVSATALTEYTALPSNFSRPFEIWYLKGGSKLDVDFLVKDEFNIKYPDPSVTGADINHYTIWGSKLFWGPTPASNLSLTFDYYGYLPDLSAPTDHNDFTDLAWELLHFKGLCWSTLYGIEDARLAVWEREAGKQETKLILEHSRKTAGRRPAARDFGYTGKL